jgi:hypothetical protein
MALDYPLSQEDKKIIEGTQFEKLQSNDFLRYNVSTIASSALPAINTDITDLFTITALAENITSFTTNLTGNPESKVKNTLIIRIKDNGTARTITWGASFASRGATLPTTTLLSKYVYVGFIYNEITSTWDCVAVSYET